MNEAGSLFSGTGPEGQRPVPGLNGVPREASGRVLRGHRGPAGLLVQEESGGPHAPPSWPTPSRHLERPERLATAARRGLGGSEPWTGSVWEWTRPPG